MSAGENQRPVESGGCTRHHYDIPFASLFKRRPVYVCKECGQKLKAIKPIEIINLFLFYGLILGIALSPDLREGTQGDIRQILPVLGKFIIYVLIYLLVRYLLARFMPLEAVEEPTQPKTKAELEEEAQEKQLAQAEEQEREALIAMYRSYELAAQEEGEKKDADEGIVAAKKEEAVDLACEHELKETWKNYLPGKQIFYCRKCGEPMKLSRAQNNIVMMAFLVSFIVFLMRPLKNLAVGWGEYLARVGVVLVLVGIVQAIIIHTHPFDELTAEETEKYRDLQNQKAARKKKKNP